MTYTNHQHPSERTRIHVQRKTEDLGDNVTAIIYTATWTDGPHTVEGHGLRELEAVINLAERLGDVIHGIEHQS